MSRLYVDPDRRFAICGVDATTRRVELWTVERLPFETDQEPHEKQMVADHVGPAIRGIEFAPGEALIGLFVSDDMRWTQPDAENVVYYNFGSAPFSGIPTRARFERSYASAPDCPAALSTTPRYYHCWEPAPAGAGFRNWRRVGGSCVAWRNVECTRVTGLEGGQHVWVAMRRQPDRVRDSGWRDEGQRSFAVLAKLRVPVDEVPSPADAVKALVDGAIASFQRFDDDQPVRVEEISGQLSDKLRYKGVPLLRACEARDLLTHRRVPVVFAGPPFTMKGYARLDPCDDRCVAGDIEVTHDASVDAPIFDGELFPVEATTPSG